MLRCCSSEFLGVAMNTYRNDAHADLLVVGLMQDHSGYDLDRITLQAPLILDTRGRLHGPHSKPSNHPPPRFHLLFAGREPIGV
jgi:hypothetical protein